MMKKTYSEMNKLKTFEERFDYLNLEGSVGLETFGSKRYLNQILYGTKEWKSVRDKVIFRDSGCDLGIEGRDIYNKVIVHHINPISIEEILDRDPCVLDTENLITVSSTTHEAIHYGNKNLFLMEQQVERKKFDTCPWKKEE